MVRKYQLAEKSTVMIPGRSSGGEADFDVEVSENRFDPADHLAGPEIVAEQNKRAFFEVADGAKEIIGKGGVVCVHAAMRQVAFKNAIAGDQRDSGPRAERFAFEALKESGKGSRQLLRIGGRDDERTGGGIAIRDAVAPGVIADAVGVAEEIERPGLSGRDSTEDAAPDGGGFASTGGLTVLVVFDELEPDGFHVRA